MKIDLKFIVGEGVQEAFGDTAFTFELTGSSVGDLIRELVARYGEKSAQVFLTNGQYDTTLQIILNGRKYVIPERMDECLLQEGDTVMFTYLVEGG